MQLPSLPQDKANHAVYGAGIALAVYAGGRAAGLPHALWWALGVVLLLGALKEGHDAWVNHCTTGNWRRGPHGVEGLDAVATWAGGAVVGVSASLDRLM